MSIHSSQATSSYRSQNPGQAFGGAAENPPVSRPGEAYGRALAGSPPSLVEIATRISAGVSSPMKTT